MGAFAEIRATVERTDTSYVAFCHDNGIFAVGFTEEEAVIRLKDRINTTLERVFPDDVENT